MVDIKTAHLFAGAGGGLYTDLILGFTPILAVEQDEQRCEILRRRSQEGWWPDLHVWQGDIRLFDPSPWKRKVDLVHAGWPCQDISCAGSGAGLNGPKSKLFWEIVRIVRHIRPRYIFLENSPAITNRGLDQVLGALAKLGYNAVWCVLPASAVGAPHRRDRWWCFAANLDSQRQSHLTRLAASTTQTIIRTTVGLENSPGDTTEPPSWFEIEPDLVRVVHGMADAKHRIAALGDGWVPLQAALAFVLLLNIFAGGEALQQLTRVHRNR